MSRQPLALLCEDADEVGAALRAVDLLADTEEDLLDLVVEFGSVGYEQDAGARDVLADPFCEPDHDQALSTALGMPYDPALAPFDALLCGPDPEILVVPTGLLDPCIEDDEVVDDLKQAVFLADVGEFGEEGVVG